MKTKNVIQFRDFLKPYKKAYISSIALAVIGVFFGLVPYYIAYHLLVNIQKMCIRDSAVGAKKPLCHATFQTRFEHDRGIIPKPAKTVFYYVTDT